MKSRIITGLAVIVSMVIAGCTASTTDNAFVIFTVGDVKVVSAQKTETEARIRQSLQQGDSVKTAGKSFVIIQIGEGIIVRVQENSVAEMKSLLIAGREVRLGNGKVLSAVKLLKQNETYSVSTPTAIAAVRGTEFSVAYDNTTNTVAVRQGTVELTGLDKKEPRPVTAGTVVSLAEKAGERPIRADESTELQNLAEVPAIQGIGGKTGKEIDSVIRPIVEKQTDPGHARSWEDLQKKYGRIDTVVLYSGREIRGAIVERGQNWKIETPAGFQYVSATSVRQTR
jgi:hypothetical protein